QHYRPSTEVVHGGRARLYFDFFSGRVTTETRKKAIHVRIEIRTKGTPILQVTRLIAEEPSDSEDVRRFPLESGELIIANWGNACKKRSSFDFLLNYLTAQGGIPHVVSEDFPLEEDLSAPANPDPFADPPIEQLIDCLDNEGDLPMCSDSRYP
ncbi:MAG TPA: hypothetical protein VHK90_09815, partial [Thermoanaerobaculia bacterium]|nr:hypothetical protein [Thermoanaerobaculia bacterium]